MTTIILRATAAAALLALGAGPALAHAHLQAETPAAGSTGPAVKVLTLQFTEGLELRFTGVVVTGPGGTPVATGPARLAGDDPAKLVVPVVGDLGPGDYAVAWHAVARDGHRTSGDYRFKVAP